MRGDVQEHAGDALGEGLVGGAGAGTVGVSVAVAVQNEILSQPREGNK